jgi:cysteinyl-tRNA synthetase
MEGKETITLQDLNILKEVMNIFTFEVLGLSNELKEENANSKIDGIMELLIDLRNQARNDKNWAMSDKIRDELASLNIELKDGKEGTSYILNN